MVTGFPETNRMGIKAARATFSSLVNKVATGDHVLICRHSRPIAALIPVSDLKLLKDLAKRYPELANFFRVRGYEVNAKSPDRGERASRGEAGRARNRERHTSWS